MLLLAQLSFQPSCTAVNYAVQVSGDASIREALQTKTKTNDIERCSFNVPNLGSTEGYQIRFGSKAKMEAAYKELHKIYKHVQMKVNGR